MTDTKGLKKGGKMSEMRHEVAVQSPTGRMQIFRRSKNLFEQAVNGEKDG